MPGWAELLSAQAAELPQRDDCCGPFWGLLALRAARMGATAELDQDTVALEAGTVLTAAPRRGSRPPGETGRDDYRLALPQAADPSRAGTSATGLARAIEQLSRGALAVVPATRVGSAAGLRRLLEALVDWPVPVAVIANIDTGQLWDPSATEAQLDAYLQTGDASAGPTARWQTGHFVALGGLLRGSAGTLVVVADSYRSRGVDGVQLQPLERAAAAIRRAGMAPGGMLLAVPAAHRAAACRAVKDAGLEPQQWDNGSPDASAR